MANQVMTDAKRIFEKYKRGEEEASYRKRISICEILAMTFTAQHDLYSKW